MTKRKKRRKRPNRWCFPAKALLDQFEEGTWANVIAERLGSNRSAVQRWRDQETHFDPYTADKMAIKLGKHPSQIWTNWFDLPELDPEERNRILNPKETHHDSPRTTQPARRHPQRKASKVGIRRPRNRR